MNIVTLAINININIHGGRVEGDMYGRDVTINWGGGGGGSM